ncbi:MAG: nickel pincer cofactor biosynthesis protein LarC [Alphaproteobacteria bacterium]|nr:nickel pincer cofactor biosynthesis protein LarC [Alphaproteobacteria bacterium]
MHIHLDAIGGVAGDMFLAAMLDARPDLRDGTLAAIRAVGLPESWKVEITHHHGSGLTGLHVDVSGPKDEGHPPHTFKKIRAMIEDSALADGVKARAVAIFAILAEAEGAVHGMDPEDVHFHEVADWDSLADIVGAAFVIDAIGEASWSVSALPTGSGRVKTAHGILPIPAPATARLLRGFETFDDGIPGERITPTGAAILKHLAPSRMGAARGAVLGTDGTGFGTREMPGLANILRALVFEDGRGETPTDVAVIEFEIDDQTPEDLAVGLDNLRSRDDVLDVLQAPVFGKKGRMAASVRLLCRPSNVDDVAAACFAETTTIGLRWHSAHRVELARRAIQVDGVRTKVAQRPDGSLSAKAEMDDIGKVDGGRAARAAARISAEENATKAKDE